MNITDSASTMQKKWDDRYRKKEDPGDACWVLKNNQHLLPAKAKCLDFACGLGANALLLANLKLEVHAWDISGIALSKIKQFSQSQNVTINTLQRDVENSPPGPNSFDIIIVSQFLHRPVFPSLINALKPGGLLFYQTFHQHKMSNQGPQSDDFLLAPGELLTLCSSLDLVFYREDGQLGDTQAGLRDCSYLVAKKTKHKSDWQQASKLV